MDLSEFRRRLADTGREGRLAIAGMGVLFVLLAYSQGWGWWSLLAPLAFVGAIAVPVLLIMGVATVLFPWRPPAPQWRGSPLSQPETPPAVPTPRPTAEDLTFRFRLPPGPQNYMDVDLYVPCWSKTLSFRLEDEDPDATEARVWPETAALVHAVLDWGPAERARVRELLLADLRATEANTGADYGLELSTVESAVTPHYVDITQYDRSRAGVGLLLLHVAWEDEHGAAIVIRDGRPAELINGLRGDAYDVFHDFGDP